MEDRRLKYPALKNARVVIVDDEPDSAEVFTMILLSVCVAHPLSFTSILRAIEAIRAAPPDLVLADLEMPEDGIELAAVIRELAIPAIAISGYARPADRERALAAGYRAFLTKPVEAEELCRVAEQLVGER
jgi:CheY-like chemotaxis protein